MAITPMLQRAPSLGLCFPHGFNTHGEDFDLPVTCSLPSIGSLATTACRCPLNRPSSAGPHCLHRGPTRLAVSRTWRVGWADRVLSALTEDPSSVPITTKIKMFKKDHFSFLLLRTLSKTEREACAQTAAMMEVRFATLLPLLLLVL